MLRQGAGLVTLQTIFDKLDYTQRLYGKIRLQAIRKNFSKGKVRNILGHDADPRFWTSHSQKYSITVEEGNYSASQRQTELQQLLHFKELGMGIADKSILRAAIITNKKQVIADMEEMQQQQAQAQQAETEMNQQKTQADIMVKMAKAKSDMAREQDLHASAHERLANINKLNSTAEHEVAQSELELVKSMILLEDMDLQNFRNALELAEYIKSGNKVESEQQSQVG